jgi:flagellar export protein FliJ
VKKFVFRLETVLDITRRQKNEAGSLYALQMRRLRAAEAELARLQAEEAGLEQALKEFSLRPQFPLEEHGLYTVYLPVVQEKKRIQADAVRRKAQEAESARQLLAKISQEVKTLEKLREKEVEAYTLDMLREEQKQLDDSAGVGFYQKNKTVGGV